MTLPKKVDVIWQQMVDFNFGNGAQIWTVLKAPLGGHCSSTIHSSLGVNAIMDLLLFRCQCYILDIASAVTLFFKRPYEVPLNLRNCLHHVHWLNMNMSVSCWMVCLTQNVLICWNLDLSWVVVMAWGHAVAIIWQPWMTSNIWQRWMSKSDNIDYRASAIVLKRNLK